MPTDPIDLELILQSITDGVVVVDQHGLVLYANASAEQIFERGSLVGRDLAIPVKDDAAYHEINLIWPSGIGWAELRSAPITWNGQRAYVIGVRDITERKQSEQGLRLAAAVFESTQEGLMVTDAKNCIVRINHAFTEITGYTEAEILGKSPALLHSGRHDPAFYARLWDSIKRTGNWRGELWNRRKSGDIYPELASISVVKDTHGQLSNYVAIFSDISALKKTQSELDFLAHHDPLTQLPNRYSLLSDLSYGMQRAQRDGKFMALLMLDLDRFKDVNDSWGHPAGDEVLQGVAARLLEQRRDVDLVCRLGGDEFAVLLNHVGDAKDAGNIANAMIKALSEPYTLSSKVQVRIGASVGISIFPDHCNTPELMLQQADSALYKAKAQGRGCFAFFSDDLTLAARERIDLEVQLRHALTHGELRVFYQPQVDIASGRMVGAEALVRWQSPQEGLIAPARFIHAAELCGLIDEIDTWVLEQTCLQGQRWLAAGFAPLTLAVNLSPYQFLKDDIDETVAQVLRDTGYPAEHLELELTESALMQREAQAILMLNKMRGLGVRLAIDDFGTGYSSLAYLKLFPLNVLKIDKRFIDDIPLNRDGMEIVNAIIAMAHALRLTVLAEGVEDQAQLDYLKSRGCDMFQGYLFGRPMPADEFEKLLRV
ncbi:MAG: GGDEF domain-containing protein [Comamonadaceae bacterium CG1_02_60_18]|nr:MAG: GGDEF domain-containing protein [Comamonadaceae bacterium CG1_02_60_18]PIQ51866.1 MAG: GGDEF domain-containing protein [Comamonadaceae bacterium CG12_big_fil_rev_8_21_14_0_65_59_15]